MSQATSAPAGFVPTTLPAEIPFDRCVIRPQQRDVLVEGKPVKPGARAFDLLLVLVARRDRVVSKNELLDLVWPGMIVEENNLQVHISALRKLLGTHAIATIPGRGYQFTLSAASAPKAPDASPQNPEHGVMVRESANSRAVLASSSAYPNNLPRQLTSFIGRDKDIAAVEALLARTRLLTLIGSGGCGKTRLSLQVAANTFEQFPDGAWFLELAPLADPGLLLQAVATALGLKEEPGKPLSQTLAEHLRQKRVLLLVDNCEHLLDACASVADMLLRQCPGLKILASSRQALGMAGEQTYRVPSLSLPDRTVVQTPETLSQYESVQLFVERALLVRADFALSKDNAAALASLCCHLDGIPLAIELAAARLGLLSVAEIDRKLDQRFRLLTGGPRTALPRHQTLQALIDWSYNLLGEPEKLLLQRLSVFAGGWTLEAAEAVCAGDGLADWEALDLLTQLCDKSLVVVEQMERFSRFRLLETVRQYAREKFLQGADHAAIRTRHSQYFLALAEEAESKLASAEQSQRLSQVTTEHENLLASLEWSLTLGEPQPVLRLCGALGDFWIMQGHLSEGRDWCERVLSKTSVQTQSPERVKALNAAGALALYQGDFAAARSWHEAALEAAGQLADQRGTVAALGGLGLLALSLGDYEAAQTQNEASLALAQQINDRRGIATAFGNLGAVALSLGNFATAQAMLDKSLSFARGTGDRWSAALILYRLGLVACFGGDCPAAQKLLEESLAIRREFRDRGGAARALSGLGMVAYDQADFATAEGLYRESLAIQRTLSDRSVTAITLEGLAEVIAALGEVQRAARIWGAMERLRADIGAPLRPAWRRHCDNSVAAARRSLNDDATFDRAWQEGRALSFEQAVDLALSA
jgi:predicted ATPase/DNA-binding winged helix-turn-helix (wHTH) protein